MKDALRQKGEDMAENQSQNMGNNMSQNGTVNLNYPKRPQRILFVCSGNTCRSPMAEALAKQLLSGVECLSAGLATTSGMSPSVYSVEVMAELGIDISGYRSRLVTTELVEWADVILTMTLYHKELLCRDMSAATGKIFTLGEYSALGEDIPDPYGLSKDIYRICRDAIVQNLQKIIVFMHEGK